MAIKYCCKSLQTLYKNNYFNEVTVIYITLKQKRLQKTKLKTKSIDITTTKKTLI